MTHDEITKDIAEKTAFVYNSVKELTGKTLVIFEGMQGTRKSSILKNCLQLFNIKDKLRVDYREHSSLDINYQNDITLTALDHKQKIEKQDLILMERSIATHIILHDFEPDEDDLLSSVSNYIAQQLMLRFDNIVLVDFFSTSSTDEMFDEYMVIKNKRIQENEFVEKDESIKIWKELHRFNMSDKDVFEQIRLGYVKFFSTNYWVASNKIKRLNMYQ